LSPPGGALAAGDSIDVQFLLGVEGGGNFRFLFNVEAWPGEPPSAPATKRPRLKHGVRQAGKPPQP